jgi:hypothetical protein
MPERKRQISLYKQIEHMQTADTCNRFKNGGCTSRSCLRRGGWTPGQITANFEPVCMNFEIWWSLTQLSEIYQEEIAKAEYPRDRQRKD